METSTQDMNKDGHEEGEECVRFRDGGQDKKIRKMKLELLLNPDPSEVESGDTTTKTPVLKRKKRNEEDSSLHLLTEVFLRVIYPLSSCMSKNITIGLVKHLDFMPAVVLNSCGKMIMFTEAAWDSFNKHMQLIECYLENGVYGRKTGIRLLGSDVEVDNVKLRGVQYVRFRDLTKHDEKIQLTYDEFYMLVSVTHAVNRYMRQLIFSGPIIKDYLTDTIDKQPEVQLLYGPVDTSIYNRLPQEVYSYRRMKCLNKKLSESKFPDMEEEPTIEVNVNEETLPIEDEVV